MTGPSTLTRAAWAVVGLLWAVALLNYLDRQLVASMGPAIKADLGITDAWFGLFSSVFLWVYGVCSPFAGYVADRVGRRPVIIGSLLIWSAATFATGFARSFESLLAARAALGVSEAFYMPAAVALIVDYHQGSTRARATGLHLSGVYAGSVLGGLGGWLADDSGWRLGFLLFGGVGVGYALVLMVVLPVPPEPENPSPSPSPKRGGEQEGDRGLTPSDSPSLAPPSLSGKGVGGSGSPTAFRALLTTPGFVLLLCMNALNGAAYWPLRNWLPMFFHDEFKVPEKYAGLYGTSTFNAAAFVGMLLGSTVSDWWARRTPRARPLVPAIGFCLAAPCLFALGRTELIPVMIGCVLAAGMSQGFLDANLMPAACTVCAPRHRATAYGLLNFVGTTAGGIMTYVGGVLKDQQVSFGATFQAGAACILAAGLLLFAVRPRTS